MERRESARVATARLAAEARRARQRARLRPLAWVVLLVVVVPALNSHPGPGWSGTNLGVTLALVAYALALVAVVRLPVLDPRVQVPLVALLGGAGIALAALQPHGAVELAAAVAVWTAAARLELRLAAVLAVAITLGLDVTIALTDGHVAQSIAASTLLCALLAVTAQFVRRSNESEDRAERLLAELQDAREAEAEAAALAERARIARDLHDVLAHSLSGLAIQLEGARVLAERERVGEALRSAIARAGELAKDGLADARRAVGALRGDPPESLDDLEPLVRRFRGFDLDVELASAGSKRRIGAEASLALYRAAQEALTNAARYAPGAHAVVTLHYEPERVRLAVENDAARGEQPALAGAGGGKGLLGMRERVESLGGRMQAGPTDGGFRVEVEVPA